MTKLIYALTTVCALLFTTACSNKSAKEKSTEETKQAEVAKQAISEKFMGVYCFARAENKDSTFVSINFLSDDDVRGEMIWQPWQKDGARGFLKGKLNAANEMELVYDYMIEGNRQTETKIMKIEGDNLSIKVGELMDPKNDGNLVFKDASKATYKTVLTKATCK